jgi:hypothetical protein
MPVHETKLTLFNEGSKVFLTPKNAEGWGRRGVKGCQGTNFDG